MDRMNRFTNVNNVPVEMQSSLRHPSLTASPPMTNKIRFYRGPLPSTTTFMDSAYNFYSLQFYKSQRLLQPNLAGSLG